MKSSQATQAPFGIFPEFTRLTLKDKPAFEAIMRTYPPADDSAFSSLMSAWWNPLDNVSVSLLNGNLVVPYWMAGDDANAGLALLGTHRVDESICTIFDYLTSKGEEPRLTHVPDYVIGNIQFPELFHFKEERKYAEYIIPLTRFYPIETTPFYWRKRIQHLTRRLQGHEVVVRRLNLSDPRDADMLIEKTKQWQPKVINDLGKVEQACIEGYIKLSKPLDIKNLCLFVDGELLGFILYELPSDQRYATVKHIKATNKSMLGMELLSYKFAQAMSEQGVSYVNINSDLGVLRLRMFMLALGPCNFFRKYTVEPA